MKINIASYGGRNWLLDTAKELEKLGHEVRFYSYLPTSRAIKFGLKKECNKSYFLLSIPFLGLLKITNRAHWALYIFHYVFDYVTALYMRPCDVFIGHSPMHVFALKYARKKYGAKIIIERGTRHVNEQIKALLTNPALNGKNPMPEMFLKRDLAGYEIADFITVPSDVVKKSFLVNHISENKIFVNPFGVNLTEFKPTVLTHNNKESFDLIMVGQWCHRKGADLITEVCKKYNYTFLHVGSIIDVDFPLNDSRFTHFDAVEQNKLIEYYSKAKVFVLPSREEGLALVQPQALVCGLPIVCSEFTGGRDLRQFMDNPDWLIEMKDLNVEELHRCINIGLDMAKTQSGERTLLSNLDSLSWEAYGKRYDTFLKSKI
jgi:glycosyltransferase involved in cell wall biosynthesis